MEFKLNLSPEELEDRVVASLASKIMDGDYNEDRIITRAMAQVSQRVDEVVRRVTDAQVEEWVDQRLSEPFHPTNIYGEKVRGATPVTVRELAMDAVQKTMMEKVDSHGRKADHWTSGQKWTRVQHQALRAIEAEVKGLLEKEVKSAVDEAMNQISRDTVNSAVKSAVWKALKGQIK